MRSSAVKMHPKLRLSAMRPESLQAMVTALSSGEPFEVSGTRKKIASTLVKAN
jgi:hypothetical protein